MFPHPAHRSTSRSGPALLAAAWAGVALLLAAGSGSADPARAHPVLRDFMRTGKYVFVSPKVGEEHPAVYFSQRAAAYLVRGKGLGDPLLVRTGSDAVESVPENTIICRDDGGCDLRADAAIQSLGRYVLEGSDMVLRVPGIEGRLKPRPNLLGWFKGTDLRDWSPEYDRDAKAFRLDDAKIQAMRARGDKVQVFLYFGCWCPTCTLLLPRILKLDEALTKDKTNVTFDYYALPPVPAFYKDPEIVLREIQRIPTGIVYVNDQYVGRLVGTEWNRPESALAGLLP